MRARIFSRRNTVLVALLGAAILFGASTQTWVTAIGLTDMAQTQSAEIPGSDISEAVPAVALVALAAAVATSVARSVGRWIISVVLFAAGVFGLASAGSVTLTPRTSSLRALSDITGTTEFAAEYTLNWGVYAAMAGGLLIAAAGLVAFIFGRSWPVRTASKKYSRSAASGAETDAEVDEYDLWDGLSEDDDPTESR